MHAAPRRRAICSLRSLCAPARKSAICNLLLLALALAPAAAADYFVAPAGSDETGTGALEKPFQSIRKGLSLAQPGDRVVLRAGEYRLWGGEGPVHFPRAGEPGKPITLTAYQDEYAALLGSLRLTAWEKQQGSLYRCPAPERRVCALYEDGDRLNQPRDEGKRENPPVSALTSPGEWTATDGFLYLWCREGDDPANHRIEASQSIVLFLDKPWVRAEKLHVFFGQPIGMELAADHVVADGVEVAHVANSVDNAYAAYFSGCSNSVLRNSMIHDSYYWGDHSSNSHVVSCIDCGDNGPNRVENCDIFNGGLGVGTKGAAREMFILNNRITDVYHGVVTSGERVSGPGAGKKDRGHYLVFGNRFRDCVDGVYFYSGQSHGNRIYGNLFQHCGTAIAMRNLEGCPEQPEFADNVFLDNGAAVHLDGGHKGDETPPLFYEAGLRSHNNLYFGNKVDWSSPLDWSRSLQKSLAEIQAYRDFHWEEGSLAADPLLDEEGAARPGSPTLGKGAPLALPEGVAAPAAWNIGLEGQPANGAMGQWPAVLASPAGLSLSIAGCPTAFTAGEAIPLRAVLKNERPAGDIPLAGDAIVSFHFRNANVWHFDKQEIYRIRVKLPDTRLAPGKTLDLAGLPGWTNPVPGKAGDPFSLRADGSWRAGWRVRATVRFLKRDDATAAALQRLESLLYSKEVVRGVVGK